MQYNRAPYHSKHRRRPYLSHGPDPVSDATIADTSISPVATSCASIRKGHESCVTVVQGGKVDCAYNN